MRARLVHVALLLVGSISVAGPLGLSSAPRDPLPEYLVKAAFLCRFAEFVAWPPASPPAPAMITIGILGQDPFGDALEKAVLGKVVDGRPLRIRRFAAVEDVEGCAILFIGSGEMSRLPQILARLKDAPVLTVGEADRFARHGGMIGFFSEDNRVRLEVNRAAAERAGLRVSSKLLAVARLVEPSDGRVTTGDGR